MDKDFTQLYTNSDCNSSATIAFHILRLSFSNPFRRHQNSPSRHCLQSLSLSTRRLPRAAVQSLATYGSPWAQSIQPSSQGATEDITGHAHVTSSSAMNSRNEGQLIFVYGTLKRGFPNDKFMPSSAVYLGTAKTAEAYPLVIDTDMHVPFLLNLPSHPRAKQVQGELYLVDASAAAILDKFEGIESGFYVRSNVDVTRIDIAPGHSSLDLGVDAGLGSTVSASAYFRSPANGGPEWAHSWTVDRLQTLEMVHLYSELEASAFVRRDER